MFSHMLAHPAPVDLNSFNLVSILVLMNTASGLSRYFRFAVNYHHQLPYILTFDDQPANLSQVDIFLERWRSIFQTV